MIEQDNPFGDGDPSLEQDVAPTTTEHTPLEVRREFLPWHKPRKQWVRTSQWAESIGRLADELRLKDLQEPLRYLSLPGPDLLDVRSIRPVCEGREIQLQFIGLNSGDDDGDAALNRALINQVRAMPGIHQASEVVTDRFEHLAIKRSIASSRIITMQRSFDVVNIDLCGSFAESMPNETNATIPSALFSLLQHQANNRSKDWLLFLTTRSDRNAVNAETMDRFIERLNLAIEQDPTVKTEILDHGLIQQEEFDENSIRAERLSAASHSNVFALGIAHWILTALTQEQPAWRADMLPHYEYHVTMQDASCDMLSLGFYCKRVPSPRQPDEFGIAHVPAAQVQPLAQIVQTCQGKIRRRIAERIDLDQQLHMNIAEYTTSLDDSARLLAGAYYDETAYRDWAEGERIKMTRFLEKTGLT
ncbi:hypothetical protein [Paraburkholderia sp.]|uniref:PP_RS20740 family protein n=1 Tax=Paraburkholderia sp. TaxID=1926495 RepID=UPI0023A6CD95|nr:hypothetical protein [Paraburkholderia sp.]MDE1182552.1 hypothetical protein [Paraburkholderia sp.]